MDAAKSFFIGLNLLLEEPTLWTRRHEKKPRWEKPEIYGCSLYESNFIFKGNQTVDDLLTCWVNLLLALWREHATARILHSNTTWDYISIY